MTTPILYAIRCTSEPDDVAPRHPARIRGTVPSTHDLDEFSLISQEKVGASAESSQAMSAQMAKMNRQMWAQTVRQMQAGVLAMVSLAASRNIAESIARYAELVRIMAGSTDAGSQFSSATARLARSGLRPIHARATANAERLGKPRRAPETDGQA